MGGTAAALKSADIDTEVLGGLAIAGLFPEANVHSSFFHKAMTTAAIAAAFAVAVAVAVVARGEHCSQRSGRREEVEEGKKWKKGRSGRREEVSY